MTKAYDECGSWNSKLQEPHASWSDFDFFIFKQIQAKKQVCKIGFWIFLREKLGFKLIPLSFKKIFSYINILLLDLEMEK